MGFAGTAVDNTQRITSIGLLTIGARTMLQNGLQSAGRDRDRKVSVKAEVDRLKDVPCADCGNRFPAVAMDFDHIGPKNKSIATMVSQGYKIDLILEEIRKCEVVCACCHRVRTSFRKDNLAPSGQQPTLRPVTLAAMEDIIGVFSEPGLLLSIMDIRSRLGGKCHVAFKALCQLVAEGRLAHVSRGKHFYAKPETLLSKSPPCEEASNKRLSNRSRVLALFLDNPEAAYAVGEIAACLEANLQSMYTLLHKMTKAGELIRSAQGLYNAPAIPVDWKGRRHHTQKKLLVSDVIEIREALLAGESVAEIASRYNLSQPSIRNIRNGYTWKHVQPQQPDLVLTVEPSAKDTVSYNMVV